MISLNDPNDTRFEAASSRLKDGLKSCQAVVSNYRALFAGEEHERIFAPHFIDANAADKEPAD